MYPPRFTLQVHGQNATHDAVALVEFKGACMDLSTEIYLSLPTAGTKYPFFSFVVRSSCIALYPGSSLHGEEPGYKASSYIECIQSYAPFVIYYPSIVVTRVLYSVVWLVKLFFSSCISVSLEHRYNYSSTLPLHWMSTMRLRAKRNVNICDYEMSHSEDEFLCCSHNGILGPIAARNI